MFTLANLMTADCGWDTVVLVHARFLVFLLVLLSFVMLETQERILVHCWYTGDAAGKTDVEKGVMRTAVNSMGDQSRKLECFGHAVVEPCCCGVSCALFAQSTVFLSIVSRMSFFCVPSTLLLCNALDATSS